MEELTDLQVIKAQDQEELELAPHEDALELFEKIMRDTRQPIQRRMRAAEQRAQYLYPRRAAVATLSMDADDFATMLDRAIQRSEVKLIEYVGEKPAPPPIPARPSTARTGPVPDRRFRRS